MKLQLRSELKKIDFNLYKCLTLMTLDMNIIH